MLRHVEFERGLVDVASLILFVPYRLYFWVLFLCKCLPARFTEGYVLVSDTTIHRADGRICSLILSTTLLVRRIEEMKTRPEDGQRKRLSMAVVFIS